MLNRTLIGRNLTESKQIYTIHLITKYGQQRKNYTGDRGGRGCAL